MRLAKNSVSLVIPNYNGSLLIKKNLPLVIEASKNPKNRIIEIIVVDDASKDESVNVIKKFFPEVRLIKHKKNRGFASSVNTGVRSSKGEYVCILNNDVSVSRNFLEAVLNHFKDRMVFGVSLHEKGYTFAKAVFKDGFITHQPGQDDKNVHKTFWVSGGSGVFRRDLWIKLGGFDEKLFKFYWEDVDISYRAAKRGLKLLWEPNAWVEHEHESTTGKTFTVRQRRMMVETNQLIFIWKNLTSIVLFKKHLLGLLKRISRHPGYLRVVLRALSKIRTIIRSRKKERREAKISDEAIFAAFED